MLTRLVAGLSLTTLAMAANPAPVTPAPPSQVQASRVTFENVTRVGNAYLVGDYIVVHDDEKMSTGEPCTTFYKATSEGARAVASFHCVPRKQAAVDKTTVIVCPERGPSTTTRTFELVEYQIAGDTEAHGVPGLR